MTKVKTSQVTKVRNVPRSSIVSKSCTNCGAWIEHWNTFSEKIEDTCSIVNCNETEGVKGKKLFGAHVYFTNAKGIIEDKTQYIIPMCSNHNNTPDNEAMDVKKGTIFVRANMSETCDKKSKD